MDNLLAALNEVAAQFCENPFRVLIVDSVMALFRVDYQGRGELSERQQRLGVVMSRLTKIACEFNCAVVVTNHVMGARPARWSNRPRSPLRTPHLTALPSAAPHLQLTPEA